jgi:hypothetical protein
MVITHEMTMSCPRQHPDLSMFYRLTIAEWALQLALCGLRKSLLALLRLGCACS